MIAREKNEFHVNSRGTIVDGMTQSVSVDYIQDETIRRAHRPTFAKAKIMRKCRRLDLLIVRLSVYGEFR